MIINTFLIEQAAVSHLVKYCIDRRAHRGHTRTPHHCLTQFIQAKYYNTHIYWEQV